MKVKALVSFSGIISMHKNEERDIKNKAIYTDLLQAGYIENVKGSKAKTDFDEEVLANEVEETEEETSEVEEVSETGQEEPEATEEVTEETTEVTDVTEEVAEEVKADEN